MSFHYHLMCFFIFLIMIIYKNIFSIGFDKNWFSKDLYAPVE